jgi:hypothetical protein
MLSLEPVGLLLDEEVYIPLNKPLTIFFGPNASGKTLTLKRAGKILHGISSVRLKEFYYYPFEEESSITLERLEEESQFGIFLKAILSDEEVIRTSEKLAEILFAVDVKRFRKRELSLLIEHVLLPEVFEKREVFLFTHPFCLVGAAEPISSEGREDLPGFFFGELFFALPYKKIIKIRNLKDSKMKNLSKLLNLDKMNSGFEKRLHRTNFQFNTPNSEFIWFPFYYVSLDYLSANPEHLEKLAVEVILERIRFLVFELFVGRKEFHKEDIERVQVGEANEFCHKFWREPPEFEESYPYFDKGYNTIWPIVENYAKAIEREANLFLVESGIQAAFHITPHRNEKGGLGVDIVLSFLNDDKHLSELSSGYRSFCSLALIIPVLRFHEMTLFMDTTAHFFGFDVESLFQEGEEDISGRDMSGRISREAIEFAQSQLLSYRSESNTIRIIAIDEPEVHLEPSLQRTMASLLEKISKEEKIYFILATHSPIFLNLSFNLVYFPQSDGKIIPKPVDLISMEEIMKEKIVKEMGLQKGELFQYFNAILFVEGKDDKRFLENLFSDELKELKVLVRPVHGNRNIDNALMEFIHEFFKVPKLLLLDRFGKEFTPLFNIFKSKYSEVKIRILKEWDILYYLDEEIIKEYFPKFPGWKEIKRKFEPERRRGKKFKDFLKERNFNLRSKIKPIAQKMRKRKKIPKELEEVINYISDVLDKN